MFESNPLNMPVFYDRSVLINDALKKKKNQTSSVWLYKFVTVIKQCLGILSQSHP